MTLDIHALAFHASNTTVDYAASVEETSNSFLDTLAVAYAGKDEPVVTHLRALYGATPHDAEHRALLNATAAHALDYDDLQFASVTHISAVVVSALMAASGMMSSPPSSQNIVAAYVIALSVARHVGQAMGSEHYAAGWHATSTLGPIAAAAGVARLWELSPETTHHALGLSLCQASGMQRSFGAMAKPLQAGMAAAAGLRSGLWAQQGITGPKDPFGSGGFETLYGGQNPTLNTPFSLTLDIDVSRKAYPCCYCAQRLVAASLDLRHRLHNIGIDRIQSITLHAQEGTLLPLRDTEPRNGNEAKFSAEYVSAVVLIDGALGLKHFEEASLVRDDILALRRKIRVVQHGPMARTLEDGVVVASCELVDGTVIRSGEIQYFPGSPMAPLTKTQLEAKLVDCHGGDLQAVDRLKQRVYQYLGM